MAAVTWRAGQLARWRVLLLNLFMVDIEVDKAVQVELHCILLNFMFRIFAVEPNAGNTLCAHASQMINGGVDSDPILRTASIAIPPCNFASARSGLRRLSRYSIIDQIGEGTYGCVRLHEAPAERWQGDRIIQPHYLTAHYPFRCYSRAAARCLKRRIVRLDVSSR